MILDYLAPNRVYKKLVSNLNELARYGRFKKIVIELNKSGKLDELGIKSDISANMYIGIDLNPELLLYSETSQESVELRLISEKMNKYNDFLTKEGILDVIKVDYDRVRDETYYGYILQLSFNFETYKKSDLIYSISYFSFLALSTIVSLLLII